MNKLPLLVPTSCTPHPRAKYAAAMIIYPHGITTEVEELLNQNH